MWLPAVLVRTIQQWEQGISAPSEYLVRMMAYIMLLEENAKIKDEEFIRRKMQMANDKVQLFEDQPIRTAWVEDEEEWYFSIVDVVGVLSESKNPTSYWRKLKQRLKEEGNETVTNCHALKMTAQDGVNVNI